MFLSCSFVVGTVVLLLRIVHCGPIIGASIFGRVIFCYCVRSKVFAELAPVRGHC